MKWDRNYYDYKWGTLYIKILGIITKIYRNSGISQGQGVNKSIWYNCQSIYLFMLTVNMWYVICYIDLWMMSWKISFVFACFLNQIINIYLDSFHLVTDNTSNLHRIQPTNFPQISLQLPIILINHQLNNITFFSLSW